MNVVCDARMEHGPGLGTFAFDDEGVPAQGTDIIRHGQFVGYMTSRETAAAMGERQVLPEQMNKIWKSAIFWMMRSSITPGRTTENDSPLMRTTVEERL